MNFLYDYHSLSKCLNGGFRHIRLCRQTPGGTVYETVFKPFYNDGKAAKNDLEDAIQDTAVAHDIVKLNNTLINQLLIRAHHACSDFDMLNLGANTKSTIYPDGNYGEVTSVNMYKKPAKAMEIAQKFESLGTTHSLFHFAADIRTAVDALETVITSEKDVVNDEGVAKAKADIAKVNLIRAYNDNYHQASKDKGKNFAELLFPQLSTDNKDDDESDNDKDTGK